MTTLFIPLLADPDKDADIIGLLESVRNIVGDLTIGDCLRVDTDNPRVAAILETAFPNAEKPAPRFDGLGAGWKVEMIMLAEPDPTLRRIQPGEPKNNTKTNDNAGGDETGAAMDAALDAARFPKAPTEYLPVTDWDAATSLRKCTQCGKPFTPKNKRSRFCSKRCINMHYAAHRQPWLVGDARMSQREFQAALRTGKFETGTLVERVDAGDDKRRYQVAVGARFKYVLNRLDQSGEQAG